MRASIWSASGWSDTTTTSSTTIWPATCRSKGSARQAHADGLPPRHARLRRARGGRSLLARRHEEGRNSVAGRDPRVLRYAMKRLLGAVPTVFLIITISFFLIRLAPGGPFSSEKPVAAEIKASLERVYHLDESLGQQYLRYLGNILQGDFGPSFKYKNFSVNELIWGGFPVSARLGGIAIFLAAMIGVTL